MATTKQKQIAFIKVQRIFGPSEFDGALDDDGSLNFSPEESTESGPGKADGVTH